MRIVKKTGITHVDVSIIEKEGFKKNSLVLTTMIPFILKERLSRTCQHKFENVRFVDDDNLIPAISANKVFLAICLKQAKYIPKTITLSLHANEKEYCVKRLEILIRQLNSSHYILKLPNASYGHGALVVKRCSQTGFAEINNQVIFGNDPVLKNVKQRKMGQLTKKLEVLNLSSNSQAYVNKLGENNTKKETNSVEFHLDFEKSLLGLDKN